MLLSSFYLVFWFVLRNSSQPSGYDLTLMIPESFSFASMSLSFSKKPFRDMRASENPNSTLWSLSHSSSKSSKRSKTGVRRSLYLVFWWKLPNSSLKEMLY